MRDYRMTLAVAVPAACALLAVLWILRKKSGKGGKPSGKPRIKEKDLDVSSSGQPSDLAVSNCSLGVDTEGITITQRKIPDTQARDRGDADLGQKAPDFTAGIQDHSRAVPAESPISKRMVREEAAALAVVENAAQSSNSVHSEALSQVQIDQVEKMIMSAIGEGLYEATGKLISSQGLEAEGDLDPSLSASSGIEIMESFDQSYQGTLATLESVPSEKVITCSSVATIGFNLEEGGGKHSVRPAVQETVISQTAIKPVSCSYQVGSEPEFISETAAEGGIQSSPQEQAAHFPSSSTDLHSSCVSALDQTLHSEEKISTNSEQYVSTDLSAQHQSSNQNPPSSPVFSSDASTFACQPLPQGGKQPQEQCTVAQNIPQTSSSSNDDAPPSAATVARRRMPAMSTGSLESQASLGPEDIDSLWGIKPLSGASANWDRQLSLDDPDSPLRKSAMASGSDMSLPSSTPSAEVEKSPSTVSSISNEQPLAPPTDWIPTAEDSAVASSPSKDSDAGMGKDIEQPHKPNSPLCDSNSEGSNDSGRGGSEHDAAAGGSGDPLIQLDFNIPSDLCGRFIGRHGKNINFMKNKTGASISLTNNPFTAEFQICQVAGTQTEVDSALAMIRRKFPLQDHPLFTMVPLNINPGAVAGNAEQQPFIVPDVMQLSLPEGVSVEVYVSAIVDAGHVFVQQPTHRSFMSLEKLTYHLNNVYGQDLNVPAVPTPVECGVICVVENEGFWYRAMIMSQEDENGEAQIKFVDYGGYANMHVSALKQIRTDFMTLPFQAVECLMGNITPLQGEEYFNDEATNALSEMTNMKLLQCQVIARTETGTPYIHLYQINPSMNSAALINRALVSDQHVQWMELVSQDEGAPIVYSPEESM